MVLVLVLALVRRSSVLRMLVTDDWWQTKHHVLFNLKEFFKQKFCSLNSSRLGLKVGWYSLAIRIWWLLSIVRQNGISFLAIVHAGIKPIKWYAHAKYALAKYWWLMIPFMWVPSMQLLNSNKKQKIDASHPSSCLGF